MPLLSDPTARVGERYGQPVWFGIVGELDDLVGRMPEAVVLDTHDEILEVVYVHRGRSAFDRPDVDDLLAAIGGAVGE